MKKMTKKKKLFRKVTALAAVIALGASLAGCGSSGEETTQRYSWPLATASPEDTVTQIFAEKFAEEISELSDGRMKFRFTQTQRLAATAICSKRVPMVIFRLSYRIRRRRFPLWVILPCSICRVYLIRSMNAVSRLMIRSFTI